MQLFIIFGIIYQTFILLDDFVYVDESINFIAAVKHFFGAASSSESSAWTELME